MLQDEYNAIDTKIHNLKDQRSDFEEKLKHTSDEDDEIEYKFQIMKINEELISLEEKHKILSEKINKEREIKEQQEKEKLRKDKLYKKLYVTLDDNKLKEIKKDLNIYKNSKDAIIKELIKRFSTEQEIFKVLNAPKVSKSELKKIVEYIESNYGMNFSGYDNGTFYFEKEVYPSNLSFKDMNESDYIDYDWEKDKLLHELYDDSEISNEFDFDIDIIDYIEYDNFIKRVREARRSEIRYILTNEEYERKRKNRETYMKNVSKYEELIAIKKAEKNGKSEVKEITSPTNESTNDSEFEIAYRQVHISSNRLKVVKSLQCGMKGTSKIIEDTGILPNHISIIINDLKSVGVVENICEGDDGYKYKLTDLGEKIVKY